jgi:flagellar P-ring protein precursor FlgI
MTPLLGPNQQSYALAQGALVVGGYQFQDSVNLRQKNYPTAGVLPGGATVEVAVGANLVGPDRRLTFILQDPDFTTAQRISDALNSTLGYGIASVRGADAVVIDTARTGGDLYGLIARIEAVRVTPDEVARVVINERTGTVVAGGGVQISSVVIDQGDIKVSVSVDPQAVQPYFYGGLISNGHRLIVTNTKMDVSEGTGDASVKLPNSTVGDLVQALTHAKVGTRSMIAILQAMKASGALHADIVVQ